MAIEKVVALPLSPVKPATMRDMLARGHAWIRLAQLRSKAALLYRGGELDGTATVLQQMIAQDLQLGLNADATLRARQAVALGVAHEQISPTALALYALTLLQGDDRSQALHAALIARDAAEAMVQPGATAAADLLLGKIAVLDGNFDEGREALQRCRSTALQVGHVRLAGLALAELATLETRVARHAAAAVCWQFCASCHQQADAPMLQAQALAAQVRSLLAAQRIDHAIVVAPHAHQSAAAAAAPEISAAIDGDFADHLLEHGHDADETRAACMVAVESAAEARLRPPGPILLALARMRLAAVTPADADAQRHWDAGRDVAVQLAADLRSDVVLRGALLVHAAAGAAARPVLQARVHHHAHQDCSSEALAVLSAVESSNDGT